MTLYTSTCEWCGKKFKNEHKNRRFCCHEHYAQSLKKDYSKVEIRRNCELCGKEFVVKLRKNGSYSSARYCSEECAIKGGQVKQKETVMEKYGVEYAAQSEVIKEKSRKTNLERYGVENTSKPEKDILVLLQEKFPDVVYQYRSELYPFDCDFYIPSLNLYVEFQGHWTHGSKPFEGTEEDLAEFGKWKQKALTSKFYQTAIYVWTELDVKKRQLARKNELNWIEFFNMDQFNEWYNTFNQRREN